MIILCSRGCYFTWSDLRSLTGRWQVIDKSLTGHWQVIDNVRNRDLEWVWSGSGSRWSKSMFCYSIVWYNWQLHVIRSSFWSHKMVFLWYVDSFWFKTGALRSPQLSTGNTEKMSEQKKYFFLTFVWYVFTHEIGRRHSSTRESVAEVRFPIMRGYFNIL